jgi:hypothetical protein
MIRRRRKVREIEFSFDSFLDVVANVVGIILRLILVAWVGARSYHAIQPLAPTTGVGEDEVAELPDPQDPLAPEVERERRELADAQARLLEQMKQWQKLRQDSTLTAEELARLTAHSGEVVAERKSLEAKTREGTKSVHLSALSAVEIRRRTGEVMREIEALRKAPPLKKTLRYRTPVSHPLQSEELLFECHRGRVALIDIGGFMDDIQRALRGQAGDLLRNTGQYSGVTEPYGPFRLRYRLAVRGAESKVECSWEVEPVEQNRGEPLEIALAAGSEFRRVIDSLEPSQTAVTLCVYPDSFALYRQLRDYAQERDIVVAGRALPEGAPIAANRHGTASRGQ